MSHVRALAAIVATLALAPAAVAGAQSPGDDPFYGVPAGIDGLANGTVIDSRPVTATQFLFPIEADAWQVRYKTQDTTGAASAFITTVLVPRTAWSGPGPRPVLSYQMPEDGVGLKCSPSWVLTQGLRAPTNTTSDAQTVATAVDRGWAVLVPDHEGPNSAWLGAEGAGRGVLDGIRAARAFAPARLDPGAPVALWGYSGGAIASSIAAQMQPTYAPDVPLAGVALGGNNASIREGLRAFDGSVAGGAVVIGLIGLDRAYPQFRLTGQLNASGKAAVAASQEDCIVDAAVRHPAFRSASALKDPAVIDKPPFSEVFARASPLTFPGTPATAVYDHHAVDDELAPIGPSRKLLERFCRAGVAVQQVEHQGEHFTEVAVGEPGVLQFLTDRFAGRPAVSTCRVGPDAAPAAARRCTSRRTFDARVRARGRITAATATLAGRRVRVRRVRGRHVVRVRLAGRGPGVVRLRVTGRTADGRRFVDRRTYRPCSRG